MIPITKDEAMYVRSHFPNKRVFDMYTGARHIEKMVRRTKNHFWCTETSAVLKCLREYREKNAI